MKWRALRVQYLRDIMYIYINLKNRLQVRVYNMVYMLNHTLIQINVIELSSVNLMEYLYVNVGEELEVKLGIQQLKMLPSGPKVCFPEHNYSANMVI